MAPQKQERLSPPPSPSKSRVNINLLCGDKLQIILEAENGGKWEQLLTEQALAGQEQC